ncbi:pentapeptide repeat-containing protein [Bradyrhizobium sp. CB1650]|uniref:pentapeptide repeat-containing protein n=1 Tax=Bradyrhizobium sp. CB1650 TaxID=3039153 RepID=UPI0024360C1A|nr:pentapeptide repeat-containing protein [Bradyrhizobium sp. CB1650]WGD53872.1 pentapeptide repeat-containing protein [Bradyrhizobium sp. CB1650]
MDGFLLYLVPACAVVALFLIYYLPRKLIPASHSSKQEDLIKTVGSRNEIRKTYAQLFAGASFVATFLLSIYNFNRDFTQRASQSAADQFWKASTTIKEQKGAEWVHVNAFEIMASVARQDPGFRPAVFQTLAQYIVEHSTKACQPLPDKRTADTMSTYDMDLTLQRITQVFAGNNLPDPYGKITDMTGACLSRARLRDMPGMRLLWLEEARLIGADFYGSDLSGSRLEGAEGGVDLVEDWWVANRGDVLKSVKAGNFRSLQPFFERDRAYHWLNFENATLENVFAQDANFSGAQFLRARMKNAMLKGANLSFANLQEADLTNVDLSEIVHFEGANLQDANLEGAILSNTILEDVNLERTFFANTNVTLADFESVKNLKRSQLVGMCVDVAPDDLEAIAYWPKLPAGLSATFPKCYDNSLARLMAWLSASLAQHLSEP